MLSSIFKAYDVRATYPEPLDAAAAWKVGFASGQFLRKAAGGAKVANPRTVLASRDMRPSSPELAEALIEGLRSAGLDVIDLGMCDTSFQYFAINYLGAIGGIQTTASHNPIQYNGFKISGPQARPIGATTGLQEIQAVAEGLSDKPPAASATRGRLEARDLWKEYRQHVLQFYTAPPAARTLKVVVDASNGMAGKLVPAVFGGVPGLEIIPLNFEIGHGFVHEPNPLVPKNMVPTQEGVVRHHADLGACFDGDADRCIFTDERGHIIGCDHLTALLCGHFLQQAPGSTIVYDLRSSKVVEEAVKQHGGVPRKSRVGHVFIKAVLRETGGVFGGELSGHFYFRDNNFADSGAIAFASVLTVLGAAGQPLSQLVAPYQQYPQSGELNFHVEDKDGVLRGLRETYGGQAAIDDLDGVTVDAWLRGGWWFNVRPSNTEPLLRLNAEARDQATLDKLLAELTPKLGKLAAGH